MGDDPGLKAENLIALEGVFLNARDEIIQPDQGFWMTKYFWTKWAPTLGLNLTMLIVQLRQLCTHKQGDGENRDAVQLLSLDRLSEVCGISESTIRRELNKPIAKQFITVSPNYHYDDHLRKKIRTHNTYHIALTDPIHPSEGDRLLQIKDKRGAVSLAKSLISDLKLNLSPRSNDLPVKLTVRSPDDLNVKLTVRSPDHLNAKLTFRSDTSPSILSTPPNRQFDRASTNVNVNTLNVNVQGQNVNVQKPTKQQDISLNHRESALVEKILSVTKDPKSEMFYRQVATNCSQANIENAIEDLKTYASSGRKIKNPGALFTSRIKNLDPYFRESKQGRG
jgi:hypothetical protein